MKENRGHDDEKILYNGRRKDLSRILMEFFLGGGWGVGEGDLRHEKLGIP